MNSTDCSSSSCVLSSSASSDCGSCGGDSCSMVDQRPSVHQEIMELRIGQLGEGEEMRQCREFYARRVQSLERFRTKTVHEENEEDQDTIFTRLQSDMVSLMESDVSLTRQLIELAERIEHLKTTQSPHGISAASSMISLDGIDEEDLNTIEETGIDAPLAATSSDECIGLDDEFLDKEPSDEVLYAVPRKQYFARQNSVLRIPIRPTRRRSRASIDFNKSKLIENSSTTSSSDGDCVEGTLHYISSSTKKKFYNNFDRVRLDGNSTLPHRIHYHGSQRSCDSGVHNLNSSVDFDKEDLVFV